MIIKYELVIGKKLPSHLQNPAVLSIPKYAIAHFLQIPKKFSSNLLTAKFYQ